MALMRYLQQTSLFFTGDDETDEDVFELSEGLAMVARVGRCKESRAKYFVHHQGEVEDVPDSSSIGLIEPRNQMPVAG